MLYVLLTIIHIFVCIFLSLVVLLQSGKGQDLASSFGGGSSQTVFGSAGPATALSKATTITAIIFMATSLGLAILSAESRSIMETTRIPVAPPAVAATPLPDEKPEDGSPASSVPAATPSQESQPTSPTDGSVQPASPPDASTQPAPSDQPSAPAAAQEPQSEGSSATAPVTSEPPPVEASAPQPAEGSVSPDAAPVAAPQTAPTAAPNP